VPSTQRPDSSRDGRMNGARTLRCPGPVVVGRNATRPHQHAPAMRPETFADAAEWVTVWVRELGRGSRPAVPSRLAHVTTQTHVAASWTLAARAPSDGSGMDYDTRLTSRRRATTYTGLVTWQRSTPQAVEERRHRWRWRDSAPLADGPHTSPAHPQGGDRSWR
jgi:hypothetical protein